MRGIKIYKGMYKYIKIYKYTRYINNEGGKKLVSVNGKDLYFYE